MPTRLPSPAAVAAPLPPLPSLHQKRGVSVSSALVPRIRVDNLLTHHHSKISSRTFR